MWNDKKKTKRISFKEELQNVLFQVFSKLGSSHHKMAPIVDFAIKEKGIFRFTGNHLKDDKLCSLSSRHCCNLRELEVKLENREIFCILTDNKELLVLEPAVTGH